MFVYEKQASLLLPRNNFIVNVQCHLSKKLKCTHKFIFMPRQSAEMTLGRVTFGHIAHGHAKVPEAVFAALHFLGNL